MVGHDAVASLLARAEEPPTSTASVALEFARAGVPVFPVAPGEKRPLTSRGFLDASTDAQVVDRWWRRVPSANLAIPTGAASGVVVVDVDVHHVDGRPAFQRAQTAGLASGWKVLVATPSGGTHAYYPATPGETQPGWQAARAGIDFRGDGGYIVIPPSVLSTEDSKSDGRYRVSAVHQGPASTIDAQRLRDVLDPRPARRPQTIPNHSACDAERLAGWVARRAEGERNHGLFWAACRLAEDSFPMEAAIEVLGAAASTVGLSEREITTTIHSAYRNAHGHPSARAPAANLRSLDSSRSALQQTVRGLS